MLDIAHKIAQVWFADGTHWQSQSQAGNHHESRDDHVIPWPVTVAALAAALCDSKVISRDRLEIVKDVN